MMKEETEKYFKELMNRRGERSVKHLMKKDAANNFAEINLGDL